MNFGKEFGEMMRAARRRTGITQNELACLVGISEVYCRQIEHGKFIPTWMIWLRICTVLNINIKSLGDAYVRDELAEHVKIMGIKL